MQRSPNTGGKIPLVCPCFRMERGRPQEPPYSRSDLDHFGKNRTQSYFTQSEAHIKLNMKNSLQKSSYVVLTENYHELKAQ